MWVAREEKGIEGVQESGERRKLRLIDIRIHIDSLTGIDIVQRNCDKDSDREKRLKDWFRMKEIEIDRQIATQRNRDE